MNGILLIDKPSGYTSRDIVNIMCKKLNTKKIGHTGTLDPMATGVLILCIGKGTKVVDILTNEDKEYIAEVTLGLETDTLDIEGNILNEVKVDYISKEKIINVLEIFLGEQTQEVPIYSSIKIKGKKLYEYARRGEEVNLPVRDINIKNIKLIGDIIYMDNNIKFKIKCLVSKGTYIRSLVRDIGGKLGYPACMSSLRRTKQGLFNIDKCYSMSDIENNIYTILSIKDALKRYPNMVVDNMTEKKVLNGMKLNKLFNEEKMLLLNQSDDALAIYVQDNSDIGKVKPLKILKTLDF